VLYIIAVKRFALRDISATFTRIANNRRQAFHFTSKPLLSIRATGITHNRRQAFYFTSSAPDSITLLIAITHNHC
jgi:hypothetical protein